MHPLFRFAICSFVFLPVTVLAQAEATPTQTGKLTVEVISELDAIGSWSLIYPNHEPLRRLDKFLEIPDLPPGNYTLIGTPPKGTTAVAEIILGDDVIKTETTPQISFEIKENMTVKARLTYALTVFGKVGVNSQPSGIPYGLHGPDDMIKRGVTPMEFPKMPIGNYSVTYLPAGCSTPPRKSGQLEHNGRVDFMIELQCATFRPVEAETDKNVTSKIGSQTVTFTDVDADAWYAPYVSTVSSRGLLTGYMSASGEFSGKFGPADPVTAAQLAKIIHTLMEIDENAVTRAPWNRSAYGQWFTRYIASAEDLGWVVYEDPALDLNRPLTRGEVMITLLQALDIPMHWPKGEIFSDVYRSTKYAGAIETSASAGLVSGVESKGERPSFHPSDPVTRAELSKIIITAYEKYLKPSEE